MNRGHARLHHDFIDCGETRTVSAQRVLNTRIGWAQKVEPQTHDQSNPIFLKYFTGKFLRKFVVKRILKLSPHLARVAALLLLHYLVKYYYQQNKH